MSNIQEVKFGKRAPSDLSSVLRSLANDVDAGRVVSLVAAYIDENDYSFIMAANLQDELVMATLLKDKIIQKFKL